MRINGSGLWLAVLALAALPAVCRAQSQYVGEIRVFGFDFCPDGWAEADGALLPIAQNTALYSLLGATYGGDGVTTFALPDLRGRMMMGSGQGPGLADHPRGEVGGQAQLVVTTDNLPAHSHALMGTSSRAGTREPTAAVLASAKKKTFLEAPADVAMDPSSIAATGGAQPLPNLPPYLALKVCIALQGVFPPQP